MLDQKFNLIIKGGSSILPPPTRVKKSGWDVPSSYFLILLLFFREFKGYLALLNCVYRMDSKNVLPFHQNQSYRDQNGNGISQVYVLKMTNIPTKVPGG